METLLLCLKFSHRNSPPRPIREIIGKYALLVLGLDYCVAHKLPHRVFNPNPLYLAQLAIDHGRNDLVDVLPAFNIQFAFDASKAVRSGHVDTVILFHNKFGYLFKAEETLLLQENNLDLLKACENSCHFSLLIKAIAQGKSNCAIFVLEERMRIARQNKTMQGLFEKYMLECGVFRLALYSKCREIVDLLKQWTWDRDYNEFLKPTTPEEELIRETL